MKREYARTVNYLLNKDRHTHTYKEIISIDIYLILYVDIYFVKTVFINFTRRCIYSRYARTISSNVIMCVQTLHCVPSIDTRLSIVR